MRKTLLTIGFIFLLSYKGNSQDTLKITASRFSTELNFNPLNGSFTLNNANAQIKIRKFISDRKALRIAITTSFLQNGNSANSNYGSNPIDKSVSQKSFMTALNIGTEKHLKGTRRISPYIGWELGFAIKNSKEIDKDKSNKTTIKGAWWSTQVYYNGNYSYLSTSFIERGFWSLGGNIVAGFDYYVAKDFYFGVELVFGLDYYKYSTIDVSSTQNTGSTYPNYDSDSWRFGPKLLNGLRVGFVF